MGPAPPVDDVVELEEEEEAADEEAVPVASSAAILVETADSTDDAAVETCAQICGARDSIVDRASPSHDPRSRQAPSEATRDVLALVKELQTQERSVAAQPRSVDAAARHEMAQAGTSATRLGSDGEEEAVVAAAEEGEEEAEAEVVAAARAGGRAKKNAVTFMVCMVYEIKDVEMLRCMRIKLCCLWGSNVPVYSEIKDVTKWEGVDVKMDVYMHRDVAVYVTKE